MSTIDENGNINPKGIPPFGTTDLQEWPGGPAIITIKGTFANANGISTVVELHWRPRGAVGRGHWHVTKYTAPGVYEVDLSPGLYYFVSAGPSAIVDARPPPHGVARPLWATEIEVTHGLRPLPPPPTVEERLAALEQRTDVPTEPKTTPVAVH